MKTFPDGSPLSVSELLRDVFDVFGAHPYETEPDRWTIEVNGFCDAVKNVVTGLAKGASARLGSGLLDSLAIDSSYFVKPGGLVCETFVKHEPHSGLSLSWLLVPCVQAHHQQAHLSMSLDIGYEWIEPWCWLSERWWRVLELLLLPLDFGFWDNGTRWFSGQSRRPEFRGKHLLRKAMDYLDRAQGSDDITFSFKADFYGDQSNGEIQLRATVLFSVYDAIRRLRANRSEPDVLLSHYLKLKDMLPKHQWRAKVDLPWRVPQAILKRESEN